MAKTFSRHLLCLATLTLSGAFGATISVSTDNSGAFVLEKQGLALGQTFRVPDPVTENVLTSLTVNVFGNPVDANEPAPVTFGYEVELFAFNTGTLNTIGPALYLSGPQIWTAAPNTPSFNPVTFGGLNLTLDSAATYMLVIRAGHDADSFTTGQIHQNLSDPYSDGSLFRFFNNEWTDSRTADLSFNATFTAADPGTPSAVPEPSTLALTVLAFVGTTAAARLRRS